MTSEELMDDRRDVFIRCAEQDLPWARWIGCQLEDAGLRATLQRWDSLPPAPFTAGTEDGVAGADHLLVVATAAYQDLPRTRAEWRATWPGQAGAAAAKVLQVRVEDVRVDATQSGYVTVDLTGLDESAARRSLLAAVRGVVGDEPRPPVPPHERAVPTPVRFPGYREATQPEPAVPAAATPTAARAGSGGAGLIWTVPGTPAPAPEPGPAPTLLPEPSGAAVWGAPRDAAPPAPAPSAPQPRPAWNGGGRPVVTWLTPGSSTAPPADSTTTPPARGPGADAAWGAPLETEPAPPAAPRPRRRRAFAALTTVLVIAVVVAAVLLAVDLLRSGPQRESGPFGRVSGNWVREIDENGVHDNATLQVRGPRFQLVVEIYRESQGEQTGVRVTCLGDVSAAGDGQFTFTTASGDQEAIGQGTQASVSCPPVLTGVLTSGGDELQITDASSGSAEVLTLRRQ